MQRLKQAERRARTRTALIDAAAELFSDHGFNGVSLDEIAARAGFSRGALHYHFAGKQELFLALLDEHLGDRATQLENAPAGGEGVDGTAASAIEAMPFDRRFSLLFLEFTCVAAREPAMATAMRARLAKLRAATTPAAEDFLRRAGADTAQVAELVPALSALLNGLSMEALTGTELDVLKARFSLVLGLILRGLGNGDG